MLYSLVKPLLFALDAERSHNLSLKMLQQFHALLPQVKIDKPVKLMGLEFPNPVGLAAGLDKNADYLDGLAKLGFGFIEVGSVTPKAQAGNPKPRMFRLPQQRSIINRLGFNNKGVDYLLERVSGKPRAFPLGINIGKNLSTPLENALDDYTTGFEKVYTQASYIAINISSPNTPGLRQLQQQDSLERLLSGIHEVRKKLEDKHQYQRPVALKVAPDLQAEDIAMISDLLRKYSIDALIATNTTIDKSAIEGHPLADQAGGLSGAALTEKSRQVLSSFFENLGSDVPIISVGGIDTSGEAKLRFELGAKLIQVYSGLIYRGPGLVKNILNSL